MMDKQQAYDYLDAHGASYEATERAAVYNMAELETVELPYPDRDAKSLFVRDGKKCAYHLITLMGDRRVDLKEFRRRYDARALVCVCRRPWVHYRARAGSRDAPGPSQ